MKRFSVLILMLALCFCFSVTAFASVEVEIVTDVEDSENTYVRGESESSGSSLEIPDAAREILNGEDHASQLFGTNNFKPVEANTGWTQIIIDGVAWCASAACGLFFAFILAQFLAGIICLIVPPFGNLLNSLHVGWLCSDTVVALAGFKAAENQTAATITDPPTTKSGKIGYFLKESLITAALAGAVLVGLATGLVPTILNLAVNAIVNGAIWLIDWIKAL